ncbi:MAG: flagellar hook-basal body complex protein [Syntrophomonas sp.]
MMRSMYSGVSGLKNHQTRMDVIGNNIANINTNGYKKSRVVFKDTLYQKLRGATSPVSGGRGGTNPMAIGLGMGVSSVDQIHTATATTTTNKLTDMAIDGNGYFVLKNGQQTYFTRAGNFDFDETGMLTNLSNGYNVQGWMADNTQTNASGDWPITIVPATTETIDIGDYKSCDPRSTTESTFAGNLDSTSEFNEIQTLSFATIANGGAGDFQLGFKGQLTDWISVTPGNPTATAASIQTALENLGTIGTGNVVVSYNSTVANPRYEIKFQNDLASIDVPSITFTPYTAFNGGGGEGVAVTDGVAATSNEEVDIDLDGATTGYYTLTYNGHTTEPIACTAGAAEISAALIAADSSLNGNIQVIAGGAADFNIEFINSLSMTNVADISFAVGAGTAFTGGNDTVGNFEPTDAGFNPDPLNCLITSQDVFDSEGNSHTVYFRFFKYAIEPGPPTVSKWACDVSLDSRFEEAPGYSSTATDGYSTIDMGPTNTTPNSMLEVGEKQIRRLYNIQFDTKGKMLGRTADTPFTLTVGNIPPITGAGSSKGADDVIYEIDLSAITQYNSDPTAKATYQDGYAYGTMDGYTVGTDGVIRGSYDNGETRSLARIALANFENPAGMIQVGGTMFQESANSGTAAINGANIEGLGSIIPSSLEMSNVDLSEEFTDMIVTQRGFQANSRIITTSDEMIQELVNLKR